MCWAVAIGHEGAPMRDYYINIFYSIDEKRYIAEFPDLPDCSAVADDPEEAVREAMINKKLWIASALADDITIPPPIFRPQKPLFIE